jgi:hypothetical protein
MKMRFLVFCLCFFCFGQFAKAQNKGNPCLIQPGYVAKIMPLSIVDSWGLPSLRIANEVRLFPGWSYELDLGYYFPDYEPKHKKIQGIYLSNQFRHYFFLRSGFIAFQILYKNQNFVLKDSVTVETGVTSNPFYKFYSPIHVQRRVLALNCVIGKQIFFDRFIWEIYGGLGFRIRNVIHLSETVQGGFYDYMEFESTRQLYSPIKNDLHPNLVLGFKFGYWILR